MKSSHLPRVAGTGGLRPRARRALLTIVAGIFAFAFATAFAYASRASALAAAAPGRAGADEKTPRMDVVRAKVPGPIALRDTLGTMLAYPPRAPSSASKPLTVVYLHGIRGRAENGCPWMRAGATEIGWLVCPAANERLPNDTFSWHGPPAVKRAVVARAERAAQAEGADPSSANVIVGFSQGGYVALELVAAHLGDYRGLVVLGASVDPPRAMLDAAGVERIVLAAGERDATFAPLQRTAARLQREGMAVRFLNLGPIGHSYETTDTDGLREAIAWSGGAPPRDVVAARDVP